MAKRAFPFLLALLLALMPAAAAKSAKPKKEEAAKPKKAATKTVPYVDKNDLKIKTKQIATKKELRDNVKHYGEDTWIDGIPMVDQGSAPACAVSVVKRLLRYYAEDNNVSTSNLAKAIGYDNHRGTNLSIMTAALQQYAPQLHMSFASFYTFVRSLEDVNAFLKLYNQEAAPRRRVEKMDADAYLRTGPAGIVSKIDFEVWRKVRKEQQKNERKMCWAEIKRNIDQGIPVVWGVLLGLNNENGRKYKAGGHLRLIIGYNEAKKYIFFSDTWGHDHLKKKMDWDDAWGITFDMLTLRPKR